MQQWPRCPALKSSYHSEATSLVRGNCSEATSPVEQALCTPSTGTALLSRAHQHCGQGRQATSSSASRCLTPQPHCTKQAWPANSTPISDSLDDNPHRIRSNLVPSVGTRIYIITGILDLGGSGLGPGGAWWQQGWTNFGGGIAGAWCCLMVAVWTYPDGNSGVGRDRPFEASICWITTERL